CSATSASGATRWASSRRGSAAWGAASSWRSRRSDAAAASVRARRLRPPLPLAQLDASDLAADGLRQALHELDLARILVGRRDPLHVPLQLVHQRLARRPIARQHDERLDDLAADRIRAGHDGRLDDGRMLEQRALHLEWPDAIARRDDDVVGPADEPE